VKTRLRGLRDIPSITRLGGAGQRHARHEYEILNELTQLGREKVRLNKERKKWQEQIYRIDERLREVEEQEGPLKQQVAIGNSMVAAQNSRRIGDREHEMIIKY